MTDDLIDPPMKTTPASLDDLRGVFVVPPLARNDDAQRSLNFEENDQLIKHIAMGGITRFLYGGNAFLYHLTLSEYEQLLDWMAGFSDSLWAIPSLGPSYGRAMDQAILLRRYKFPCAMMLPCNDPRDAKGIEQGLREVVEAAATKLILYLKEENSFGTDREAGLDVVARLVEAGVCVGIKYAVVRSDPRQDVYLEGLLARVNRNLVISGIGERPAITHMQHWQLPGFTTGSGSIAPRLSNRLFHACQHEDYATARSLREEFLPLEDLRDAWSPAKVLHHTTELAGIAQVGPVPPYLAPLSEEHLQVIAPIARALVERNERG